MTLRDYCLDNHLPLISGEACKMTFFSFLSLMKIDKQSKYGLLVGNYSIVDHAAIPNPITEISLRYFMLAEDGPSKLPGFV